MTSQPDATAPTHLVSVVIPVYRGESHLRDVVEELVPYTEAQLSPGGRPYRVAEIVLVHDGGSDGSPRVMRELAAKHEVIRNLWLSRNYGQHAATLAGIASTGGDWIVTMDEDGQHDPRFIPSMLDVALTEQSRVVYARPVNLPHHSAFRNLTSRYAKKVVNVFSGVADAALFQSYRLILGEVGRSIAAYAGSGVYLDVALGWVTDRASTAPVELRAEGEGRISSYSLRRLLGHFLRMVVTGGTRGLRVVGLLGIVFALLGMLLAVALVIQQLVSPAEVQGWTSLMVVVLVTAGAILFSLGVTAEYIGVTVNSALGKPLYLLTQDPAEGPLGRDDRL